MMNDLYICEFKSQVEVLQALLDGKEVYREGGDGAYIIRYKIINGAISFTDNGGDTWHTTDCNNFASYYLYNTYTSNEYKYTFGFTIKTNHTLNDNEILMIKEDLSKIHWDIADIEATDVVLLTGINV